MTYYTHINRNKIDSNRKNGTNDPVITVLNGKYGKPNYGHCVRLPAGAVLRYYGEPVLPCGARVVIESEEEPEIE